MNEIRKSILKLLHDSLEDAYTLDDVNLKDGVAEWNICARLAMYMEKRMRAYDYVNRTNLFKDYYVDVEYNRSFKGGPKIVAGHKVRVDLIVHTREETKPNYLVLEMKKLDNLEKREDDERELDRMVRPREEGSTDYYNCGSYVGVFIDYSSTSYVGKIYWYNDSQNDVSTIDFTRDDLLNLIGQFFV